MGRLSCLGLLTALALGGLVCGCGSSQESAVVGEQEADTPNVALSHPGDGFDPTRLRNHDERLVNGTVGSSVAAPAIDRLIAAGQLHTCLRHGDAVACWGANEHGQLGDDTTIDRLLPTTVVGLTDAASIVAGTSFTCARRSGGTIACWGNNEVGQLGNGSSIDARTPVDVKGISDAVEVVAGSLHACARRADGHVACWGTNRRGQIGDGTITDRDAPVAVSKLADAVELAAGKAHTCARRANGTVACWGHNFYGQVGEATAPNFHVVPWVIPGLDDVVEITTGHYHTCARRAAGDVRCWGQNLMGQLGDGSVVDHTSPTPVVGVKDAVQITAGGYHTCARRSSGELSCWGYNAYGQLGDASYVSRATPVTVIGVTDAIDLVAGRFSHTCARRASGEVACWGWNLAGEIGDGTTLERPLPVSVVGLP